MKPKAKVTVSFIFLLAICLILIQAQSFKVPLKKEIIARLNYLERVVKQPLQQGSEITILGEESSEFKLFSYCFTTYALTNLAIRDSFYQETAMELIKESISKVLDPRIASGYGVDTNIALTDSIPSYSVLYLGHLNLMMGCYRLLCNDTTFHTLNDRISKSLVDRYNKSEYMNLESYPSSIWIPDNTVAIASLKLHSINAKSRYDSICSKWTQYAKAHYLDKETSVLYSTIHSSTGAPEEEPRGSMLGWSIMFIYQFDEKFAVDLYHNYKKHFSHDFLLFRLFKERHDNQGTNLGDIDSGPIFLGYSIPANEFALSNSILAGDYKTAKKLNRLINLGARRITQGNEIKYRVRFVKMNVSPMAEALVLNSLTMVKWTRE